MKKIVLVGILASISSMLGAANMADRMAAGIEMRQLELKTPQRTPKSHPQTPKIQRNKPKTQSTTQFMRSMDAHGTGDLQNLIHSLNDTDLRDLSGAINTYFQGRWYTRHKESTFAKAVADLSIGADRGTKYTPSTKITRSEIETLRDIVNARLADKNLSTDNGTDTMSQDSATRKLDFASDTNSTQDNTESEADTSSQSPINVTNLSKHELDAIQEKIDEYERMTGFRKESKFANAVNALNIEGVRFDTGWLSSAPKREEILALKRAVDAQLERHSEGSDTETIASQAYSDPEESSILASRSTSPHMDTVPQTLTNQTRAMTGNAPEVTANGERINVDALIADASATGNLAEKTAEAPTAQAPAEKKKGFTGKQYAAAGAVGGLLSTALLSPELRSGQNPVKILMNLLPFMTPARVKTLTRAQKIALGRLVTAAIVGTAGVGSMGYGAYKMYKTAKAA